MLSAALHKLGDVTVLRCHGRIVIGDDHTTFRNAVLDQIHTSMLVLDLAQVDRIDAGGLGILLGLREWACSNAIRLKLMNVTRKVEQVLELTRLDRVFEFCSARDMLHLLHRAAVMEPSPGDESSPAVTKHSCNCSVVGSEAPFGVNRGPAAVASWPNALR